MGFLIKAAFWLTIVLLLIPADSGSGRKEDRVDAADAVAAAQATFEDVRGFCGRQHGACDIGGKLLVTLSDKAQAGAKMLYDFLRDRSNERAAPVSTGSTNTLVDVETGARTLLPAEREVPWHAPETAGPRRRG